MQATKENAFELILLAGKVEKAKKPMPEICPIFRDTLKNFRRISSKIDHATECIYGESMSHTLTSEMQLMLTAMSNSTLVDFMIEALEEKTK